MPKSDRIAMRHPELPGREPVVVHRSAFPAHAARGWVEVKSSAAKAAVETTPPTVGAPTSKEDTP